MDEYAHLFSGEECTTAGSYLGVISRYGAVVGNYLLATISPLHCIWVSSARCALSSKGGVPATQPYWVACFIVYVNASPSKRPMRKWSAPSGWTGVPEYTFGGNYQLHWNRQGMTETRRLYSVMRQNMHPINRHGSGKFSPSRSSPDT